MKGASVFIWKYEAQHHWATAHGTRIGRADIGSASCPIPADFAISDAEWAAMTGNGNACDLLGY